MRKNIWFLLLVSIYLLLTACAAPQTQDPIRQAGQAQAASTEDGAVVAIVNGEEITQKQFEDAYRLQVAFFEANRALYGYEGEFPDEETYLQSMIELRVCLQEAERLGLEPTQAQMDEYFAEADAIMEDSDEEAVQAMNAYLEGIGMDPKTYRETTETKVVRETILLGNLAMHAAQNGEEWEGYKAALLEKAQIERP